MKPTQEQVIAWAREAGFSMGTQGTWNCIFAQMNEAFALAYEAGRKDGREEYIAVLGQIIGERAQGENND